MSHLVSPVGQLPLRFISHAPVEVIGFETPELDDFWQTTNLGSLRLQMFEYVQPLEDEVVRAQFSKVVLAAAVGSGVRAGYRATLKDFIEIYSDDPDEEEGYTDNHNSQDANLDPVSTFADSLISFSQQVVLYGRRTKQYPTLVFANAVGMGFDPEDLAAMQNLHRDYGYSESSRLFDVGDNDRGEQIVAVRTLDNNRIHDPYTNGTRFALDHELSRMPHVVDTVDEYEAIRSKISNGAVMRRSDNGLLWVTGDCEAFSGEIRQCEEGVAYKFHPSDTLHGASYSDNRTSTIMRFNWGASLHPL